MDDFEKISEQMKALGVESKPMESSHPDFNIDALIAKGWRYEDFPKMNAKDWVYLLTAFGTENTDYYKLTEASYQNGKYKRGQLLISPQAILNAKQYVIDNPQT